jgi:tetratricopeptide (TPR) repeat protein
MARLISIIIITALLNVFTGCYSIDSGKSQLVPKQSRTIPEIKPAEGNQADIVEELTHYRKAYTNALKSLIAHYKSAGNNMKLNWAQKELEGIYSIPQYNYIVEAAVAGPELRASADISDAELMFLKARQIHKDAGQFLIVKNDDMLRQAFAEYNEIIRKHPASERIDDAAYYSAKILEHFKDYTLALLYYQRAYQWEKNTPYPAKYKAAYILDTIMSQRKEALELYKQALENEKLDYNYREFAQQRVNQLTSD